MQKRRTHPIPSWPVLVLSLVSMVCIVAGCRRSDAPNSQPQRRPAPSETQHGPPVEASPPRTQKDPSHSDPVPSPGREETVPSPGHEETVILAGGCFWGMEEILRDVPGVLNTQVGYAGGTTAAPSYEDVSTGATGHAESVKVTFDPQRLSFSSLLVDWFFKMHDPTTLHRQGNDVGSQYRSAIFFTTPNQEEIARQVLKRVAASGHWSDPVVTEIAPAGDFTPAEEYHQDYLEKNPGGYTCHYLREVTY